MDRLPPRTKIWAFLFQTCLYICWKVCYLSPPSPQHVFLKEEDLARKPRLLRPLVNVLEKRKQLSAFFPLPVLSFPWPPQGFPVCLPWRQNPCFFRPGFPALEVALSNSMPGCRNWKHTFAIPDRFSFDFTPLLLTLDSFLLWSTSNEG